MRANLLVTAIATTVVLVAGVGAASGAYQRPGKTHLVSISSSGRQGEVGCSGFLSNNNPSALRSYQPSISGSGRWVAFASCVQDLVTDDDNGSMDIFVHDMKTRKTQMISRDVRGLPLTDPTCSGFGASMAPTISETGRFIAYQTCYKNSPADVNSSPDVYVYDRRTRKTTLVSAAAPIALSQQLAAGTSYDPAISANGRYVTFTSTASNLIEEHVEPGHHVYVRDLWKGTTELVDGTPTNGSLVETLERTLGSGYDSGCPSINTTGRYISFASDSPNLVSGDTNRSVDVFLKDLKTGKLSRVSVASDGSQGKTALPAPIVTPCFFHFSSVSRDGRLVSFESSFENLVPNDTNGKVGQGEDVFVRDLGRHRTERVSVASSGEQHWWGRGSVDQTLSGRYVAMEELNGDFDECSPQGCYSGVFVYDRKLGYAAIASPTLDGSASGAITRISISANGKRVAFDSSSSEMVKEDTDGWASDVFTRDFGVELGVGHLVASGRARNLWLAGAARFARTGTVWIDDADSDAISSGAELLGARVTYRPLEEEDIFLVLELEHMPQVLPGVVSPIFYGLQFETWGKSYEVRATSLAEGTFGLFYCTNDLLGCTKVADLRGGYGTTGMRVVFSLPLEEIGLENGGRLSGVRAFSAFGTFQTGATKILDTVTLK